MYLEIKKSLGTEITVAFNKVDDGFKVRELNTLTTERFERHKEKTAKELCCAKERIYYVCLDPEESKMRPLKQVGVLDFPEFAQKLDILQVGNSVTDVVSNQNEDQAKFKPSSKANIVSDRFLLSNLQYILTTIFFSGEILLIKELKIVDA